jgi:hypothetical protein
MLALSNLVPLANALGLFVTGYYEAISNVTCVSNSSKGYQRCEEEKRLDIH